MAAEAVLNLRVGLRYAVQSHLKFTINNVKMIRYFRMGSSDVRVVLSKTWSLLD